MIAPIGKPRIAALLPHTGTMCLLDAVRFWDSTTIVCSAASHRDAANPLACDGRLDAVCGIEYAAQAMAVHGGLTATTGKRPAAGYLGSVRDVVCHAASLNQLTDELEVTATRLAGDDTAAMYRFSVRCGSTTIVEGRAAVVIDAASRG